MDVFNKLVNSFKLEQEKLNNNIENKKVDLSLLAEKLKCLSLLEKQLEDDIVNFDVDMLKRTLEELDITIISDLDLKTITGIKKLTPFLFDPNILNVGVKKEKLFFIKNLKFKMAKIRSDVENKIENINNEISSNYDIYNKFEYYQTKLNDEFYLVMSVEELNGLFDFLEGTNIDKRLILDFIYNVNIKRLSVEEKLNKNTDEEVMLESENVWKNIDNNANEIFGDLNSSRKNDSIDLSFLSEEEKKLIFQIETLILEQGKNISDNLNSFIKDFFLGISLDERIESYLCEDGLDWSMIAADYRINLFSNIVNNKQEVFKIINYVITENKKINDLKKEYNENLSDAKDLLEYLKSISLNGELFAVNNEYYNLIYNYIYELDKIVQGNDLNYLNMKSNNTILLKLLNDSKNLVERLNEISKSSFDKDDDNSLYDLGTAKTICLLLKDDVGNYVPYREIDKEENNIKNNTMKNELKKVVYKISSMGMYDNRRRFNTSHVTDVKSSGKENLLSSTFGFDIDRIRCTNDGRTCYIPVPVCEENRKKIISMYGDDVFYKNYNSIILIVSTIFCSAGHNEYNSFQALISENQDYINYIVDLFKNPNANVSELQAVIEESANVLSRDNSENKIGGRSL